MEESGRCLGGGQGLRCGEGVLGPGAGGHRALATSLFSPWCAPSRVDDLCVCGPTRPQVHTFSEEGHEFAWVPRDWPLLLLSRFLPRPAAAKKRALPRKGGPVGSRHSEHCEVQWRL